MATQRYDFPIPAADPVAGPNRLVTPIWLRLFNAWRERFGVLTEQTQTYDPPNILSGATASVAVSFAGAKPGDKAWATHSTVQSGIILLATATTSSVTVTFWNVSGAPIDLASGTLRVGVESTT